MRLYNIPIESLEERYSAQWNKIFPEKFKELGIEYITIYPEPATNKINKGKFLDIVGTNHFKANQLSKICELFMEDKVKDGDVFFFHDLWFPGLEMLFYMRDALKINIKIGGMLHAGTYDPFDFLTQCGMAKWGNRLEQSWLNGVDFVFVATEYHKNLFLNKRDIYYEFGSKIFVTGFPHPFNISLTPEDISKKENIVVFPHRMDPEKNPEMFREISKEFEGTDWKFIFSKEVCKNKNEYYDLLKKSKIALSFADQETWGIAQQEAMFSCCIPLVPNRLSYKEMYNVNYQYIDLYDCKYKLYKSMVTYDNEIKSAEYYSNISRLATSSLQSIPKMMNIIKNLKEN